MKKDIPISLRKILDDEYLNAKGLFEYQFVKNSIILFNDSDTKSKYHFEVVSVEEKSDPHFNINYYPSSDLNLVPFSGNVKISQFRSHFKKWKSLLIQSNSESPLFDDPIIESFRDDYYTEFEIVDEEKNKTLKPKQILLLDSYFEKIDKKIEKHINESNSEQIAEIKEDILELRENLSSKTKVWIANKVSWIWAKMTKLGPKLMKDFVNESNKQIVKESVSQIIEIGKNLLS